jgi:hypothetical protein
MGIQILEEVEIDGVVTQDIALQQYSTGCKQVVLVKDIDWVEGKDRLVPKPACFKVLKQWPCGCKRGWTSHYHKGKMDIKSKYTSLCKETPCLRVI